MDNHKNENKGGKALTRIRPAYTLFDTPEPELKETERLIMKNFLDTLAEVSLSIVARINEEDKRQ